jgi:hypothetical protein
MLVSIMDEIVQKMPLMTSYPAFNSQNPNYLQKLFEFVAGCFLLKDQQLKGIPEILTYSVLIYTASTEFMRPFYVHFS